MDKAKEADYNPKCPFCDKEIEHLMFHESKSGNFLGLLGAKLGIFSCPHCRCVLGTASRAYGEA